MRNEGHETVTSPVEADRGTAQTRERRRSTRLILVMRGLRSLAYGLLAVILGVVLAGEGFSPVAIGVLITVSLLGDMVGTYVIGLFADAWGRRRTLALLALLMAGTGVIFGLVTSYPVLLVAAFFGTLGTSASETAPFLPIDQAMIAQVTEPSRRTVLFARYNLVASGSSAGGALVAGMPGLLTQAGLPLASGIRLLFGVSLTTLSALFFGANLLSALSFLAAVPLARRFGLLNTMVFTHLPSNILLALVAFAPTFPLAAALLLMRQALSQMDVPTRQAYTMALVDPQERTSAASVTSLARSVGSASSPVFSGLLLQGPLLVLGLPFILAGMLKSAYDCSLWMVFRHVHLEEEQRAPTQEPARPGEVSHAPKDGARTQTDDGRSRQR